MSGGVDSSVAAALLLRQGYEVMGVFLRLGSPAGGQASHQEGQDPHHPAHRGCCSVLDAADARRVAAALGIPFYVLNFQDEFGRVVDYFVAEYNRGRTPNPCIRCNDWLKFGKLLSYAQAAGAEAVATGHYARIEAAAGGHRLLRSAEVAKDQSYVLFGLRRQDLGRILFPVGDLAKPTVRQLARELQLPVYDKPESQEICFVPDQDYAALLRRRTPEALSAGPIVDQQGQVLGQHQGHQHFTIGQRRGLGIAASQPLYVIRIEAQTNRVVVGARPQLLHNTLEAADVNWLCDMPPEAADVSCLAKIRYNHAPQPARFSIVGPGRLRVRFDQPQSAITPGQAVVLYDGQAVLGGGWIDQVSGGPD